MEKLSFSATLIIWICGLIGCAPSDASTPDFSVGDKVHFVDVAQTVGLDFKHNGFEWGMSGDPVAMMGGGLCWIDYDNDGWLDLYVVNSYSLDEAGHWQSEMGGLPTSRLYKNQNGRFQDVSEEMGVGVAMRGNGCVAADLDLDGKTDLYVTTSRSNFLFWNNGTHFVEGGQDAGLGAYGWHSAVSVGDVNSDRLPDLFVAGYVNINAPIEGATMGFPNTHLGVQDLLFLNNGDRTFREAGERAGLETADFEYGLGSLLQDFDGDMDLDLLIANDTNPNRLFENVGGKFVAIEGDVSADTNSGMGIAAGEEIVVTNMGHQHHSFYARSGMSFENGSLIDNFGVDYTGWGASWLDVELDGDMDLLVVHGKIPLVDLESDAEAVRVFENLGNGQFSDENQFGLDALPLLNGRGSATADYDNDGDMDVAINSVGGELVLLENRGAKGNWLGVDVSGMPAGTVISIGDQTKQSVIGSSYLASEDPRIYFGLDKRDIVEKMTVQFPDGRVIVQKNVSVNQILRISR